MNEVELKQKFVPGGPVWHAIADLIAKTARDAMEGQTIQGSLRADEFMEEHIWPYFEVADEKDC